MQLNEEQVNAKSREKNQQMNYPSYSGRMNTTAQGAQVAQNRPSVPQGPGQHVIKQPGSVGGQLKQTPVSVAKQQVEMLHE